MRALELDRLFHELGPAFRSGSARLALEALVRLIEAADGRDDLIRPYLDELAPELGTLLSARTPRGLAPERMERVWRALDRVGAPLEALLRLRLLTGLVFAWVGDWHGVSRSIGVPLPAHPPEINRTEHAGHDRLVEWLRLARERGLPAAAPLSDLLEAWDREDRRVSVGVAIPVVQQIQGDHAPLGRLRRVSVDLFRRDDYGLDEIHAAVALAEDTAEATFASDAVAAARALLRGRGLVRPGVRFAARIVFEEGMTIHRGSSADLAIGALFYVRAANLAERRTRIILQPGVAMTGGLGADGGVLDVEPGSLQAKVEAAFFSPARILVVPEAQREQVMAQAASLHARYPGRSLPVLGVQTLEDVFFDVRVARESVLPAWRFGMAWVWRRKFTAGGMATVAVLALALALTIWSRVDTNPVSGRITEDRLVLTNQFGQVVRSIDVGEVLAVYSRRFSSANDSGIFDLYDLDGDGDLDVCYGFQSNRKQDAPYIACVSTGGGEISWRRTLDKTLNYASIPPGGSHHFGPRQLDVVPCSEGSGVCLFARATHAIFFAALIVKLDAVTGEELGVYVHNGILTNMAAVRDPTSGIPLILFGGASQFRGEPVLGALDSRFIDGQSPSGGQYVAEDIGPGLERHYIRFPLTPVGEVTRYLHQYRSIHMINTADSLFFVRFWDTAASSLLLAVDPSMTWIYFGDARDNLRMNASREGSSPWVRRLDSLHQSTPLPLEQNLIAEFGYDFEARRIWSGSEYDLMVDFLMDHGFLEQAPDTAYWEAYRKSLLYWNGDDWVTQPVMNRHYLEAMEGR